MKRIQKQQLENLKKLNTHLDKKVRQDVQPDWPASRLQGYDEGDTTILEQEFFLTLRNLLYFRTQNLW